MSQASKYIEKQQHNITVTTNTKMEIFWIKEQLNSCQNLAKRIRKQISNKDVIIYELIDKRLDKIMTMTKIEISCNKYLLH